MRLARAPSRIPGPARVAPRSGEYVVALPSVGAAVALVAIFLPSFLILVAILPFWSAVRRMPAVRSALAGVNAAVVGLLLAALYDPVWTSSVANALDLALALGIGI